jgi:hypothetical protein
MMRRSSAIGFGIAIVVICAAASAQAPGKTWEFSNSGDPKKTQGVELKVTRTGHGYAVSGDYSSGESYEPNSSDSPPYFGLSGTYFPGTGHMKGRAERWNKFNQEKESRPFEGWKQGQDLRIKVGNAPEIIVKPNKPSGAACQ